MIPRFALLAGRPLAVRFRGVRSSADDERKTRTTPRPRLERRDDARGRDGPRPNMPFRRFDLSRWLDAVTFLGAGFYSVWPPSTTMVCPVTQDASGEARNITTFATSSG